MNDKALGIIETVGLIPAVEAGDVALKTADVTLLGSQAVGGGFVSILLTGNVSAVRTSIDAGRAAAERLGEVSSVTVIARTAEGLDEILIDEGKRPEFFSRHKEPADAPPEVTIDPLMETEPVPDPASGDEPEVSVQETPETDSVGSEPVEDKALSFDMADLKKFKVAKLRRLAQQLPTFSIPKGDIEFARKKDLLEAFTQYLKTIEK